MPSLKKSQVLAAVSGLLEEAGYLPGHLPAAPGRWIPEEIRLYEDEVGVVACVAYETWHALERSWREVQSVFVEQLSTRLGRSEPKSWEGYLLLFCLEPLPVDQDVLAQSIRYDTSFVRKLLITGENLDSTGDVENFLAPLLPVSLADAERAPLSILSSIPSILASEEVGAPGVEGVVGAFLNQESALDILHQYLWDS